MSLCKSVTDKGTQCSRNALPGRRYCWQHDIGFSITLGGVIAVILVVIALWADLISLGFPLPTFYTSTGTAVTSTVEQTITPVPLDATSFFQDTKLETERVNESPEIIEVSWKNLPSLPNLYLMTSDGKRYYAPIKIWDGELSGERRIAIGRGITMVAIIMLPENLIPENFPPEGVEPGNPTIPIDVKISESIPDRE